MQALMESARAAGLRRIEGLVLSTNQRMLDLMHALGFSSSHGRRGRAPAPRSQAALAQAAPLRQPQPNLPKARGHTPDAPGQSCGATAQGRAGTAQLQARRRSQLRLEPAVEAAAQAMHAARDQIGGIILGKERQIRLDAGLPARARPSADRGSPGRGQDDPGARASRAHSGCSSSASSSPATCCPRTSSACRSSTASTAGSASTPVRSSRR